MTDEKHTPGADQRGVDGLTEVLRLQAEALSRISERMSGIRAAAPGSSPAGPSPLSPDDTGSGAHLPVLAGDPSLNEESLPVLNSFKKFLDQERRHARKRMLWILLGFTVVLAGVLAVIVWMNGEHVQELKSDIIQTRSRAEQSQQAAEAEIKRVAENAARMNTQSASTMRKDITRNILWAHSVISSNMSSELTGRDGQMDQLKDKVSALELENTMLSRRVNDMAKRLALLEDDLQERLVASEMHDRDAAASASNAVPAAAKTAPLMINSTTLGRSMQLHVPQE